MQAQEVPLLVTHLQDEEVLEAALAHQEGVEVLEGQTVERKRLWLPQDPGFAPARELSLAVSELVALVNWERLSQGTRVSQVQGAL